LKTLNKFLATALAVGLVVAPLAVNAEWLPSEDVIAVPSAGLAPANTLANSWATGVNHMRQNRLALQAAVTAAREEIAANNTGLRANIPGHQFDFDGTWTNASSATGNFWTAQNLNNCTARLTAILDAYSRNAETGEVNWDHFLAPQMATMIAFENARLTTYGQFGRQFTQGLAGVTSTNPRPVEVAGEDLITLANGNVMTASTFINGNAHFRTNDANPFGAAQFTIFTDGGNTAPVLRVDETRILGSAPFTGQGAVDFTTLFSPYPNATNSQFEEARFEYQFASESARFVRRQLEEVLVLDCGRDPFTNQAASTTAPTTAAPTTTAPAGTTTGGGGAQLPQTNTAVVATGLAGVGVTGLGAMAAFLKNKKA